VDFFFGRGLWLGRLEGLERGPELLYLRLVVAHTAGELHDGGLLIADKQEHLEQRRLFRVRYRGEHRIAYPCMRGE
jgi:hypothetical protein